MDYQYSQVTHKEAWDALCHKHWQHTWEFAQIQKKSGRTSRCITIHNEDDTLVGYFTILSFPIFKGKTVSYLPYGPCFTVDPTTELYISLYRFLCDYGKKNKSLCVRTELNCAQSGFFRTPLFAYRTSYHQPRGEAIMNLRNTNMMNITSRLSKSTRRNIKKSEKNNLHTTIYTGEDLRIAQRDFIAINSHNTQDHNTTTHSPEYFNNLFEILGRNENNFVVVVSRNDILLAINVYTVFNDQVYCPFGASTNEGKKLGAYYWIKYKAIEHMLEKKYSQFNWGGVAVGKNDENLQGLNSFKLGWGTEVLSHKDFYDIPLSLGYWMYLVYNYLKKFR